MGNVGNGDVKTVILAALFGIDGIIEITRANAVNRYKGQMAQIETAFVILVAQGIGNFLALFAHHFGEYCRDIVVFNGDIYFHSCRHGLAQYRNHFANRLLETRRVGGDFANDDLPRLAAAKGICRND